LSFLLYSLLLLDGGVFGRRWSGEDREEFRENFGVLVALTSMEVLYILIGVLEGDLKSAVGAKMA
jgi:hypothetical protein